MIVKMLTFVFGNPISYVRVSPATPRETDSRTWENYSTKTEKNIFLTEGSIEEISFQKPSSSNSVFVSFEKLYLGFEAY